LLTLVFDQRGFRDVAVFGENIFNGGTKMMGGTKQHIVENYSTIIDQQSKNVFTRII